jgi:hypothetical protein
MNKLLLSLIAVPFFMATAQQLHVKNITAKCPDPMPGQEWKPTIQLVVEGGTAPYTFSSANPSVAPVVSEDAATFSFDFPPNSNDETISFTVTDNGSPAQTTSFEVNLYGISDLNYAVFDFVSPTVGSANGIIKIQISDDDSEVFDYYLNNVIFGDEGRRYWFTNVKAGTYEVGVIGSTDNKANFSIEIKDVQLNALGN